MFSIAQKNWKHVVYGHQKEMKHFFRRLWWSILQGESSHKLWIIFESSHDWSNFNNSKNRPEHSSYVAICKNCFDSLIIVCTYELTWLRIFNVLWHISLGQKWILCIMHTFIHEITFKSWVQKNRLNSVAQIYVFEILICICIHWVM